MHQIQNSILSLYIFITLCWRKNFNKKSATLIKSSSSLMYNLESTIITKNLKLREKITFLGARMSSPLPKCSRYVQINYVSLLSLIYFFYHSTVILFSLLFFSFRLSLALLLPFFGNPIQESIEASIYRQDQQDKKNEQYETGNNLVSNILSVGKALLYQKTRTLT